MMRSRIGVCAIAAVLVTTMWCGAGEVDEKADEGPSIYAGGGAVVSFQPYVGTGTRVYGVPLFGYEGKRLYFRGPMGGYWLYSFNGVSIGPVIKPRFEGYEEDDSRFLEGMDDRDWSVDGGIGINWLTDIGLFGAMLTTDLLGRHDGQELDFSYTVRFEWAGLDFLPSLGVKWKSDNLVDYYYGVRASEARFDPGVLRAPYEGNDAVDPYARLTVIHKLGRRWRLLGAVQYEWLDDEITESPIVEDNYEASFLLGLLYTW